MTTCASISSGLSPALVTAVVLNFIHYDETIGCVSDILLQNYAHLHCVVVDNASPNDSFLQLERAFGSEPRVTLLASPSNSGYAAGNNFGVRWALANHQPRYVLIANPDVRMPDNSTISKLVAFADLQLDAGVVSPKVILPDGFVQGPYSRPNLLLSAAKYLFPLLWLALRRRHQRIFRAATRPVRCFCTIGACMLLRSNSFVDVNCFDEGTFLESEEPILAERLKTIGQYFYHLPTTTVVHHHTREGSSRASVDSLKYYFSRYRNTRGFAIRLLEISSRIYESLYLPLKRRLPAFR